MNSGSMYLRVGINPAMLNIWHRRRHFDKLSDRNPVAELVEALFADTIGCRVNRSSPAAFMATLLLCLLPLCSRAEGLTMTELGKLLTRTQDSTVSYVEHQYRKVLTTPIEQSGELHYAPPDVFEKRVTQPVQESYRLSGETLTINQAGHKPKQLSTRNQPLLRGLLLGFQGVVSGRLSDLQPYYQCELSGSADAWRLTLHPTDEQLKHYIEHIVITGHASEPQQFSVFETSGDRVITDIKPASH